MVVLALSFTYVIYAFMERPWHDNEAMLVFSVYRESLVDKIISGDLVVCDPYAHLNDRGLNLTFFNSSIDSFG
jgi:hypothetical protein